MGFKPNPRTIMTLGVIFSWYAHSCQTNTQSNAQSFEIANEANLSDTNEISEKQPQQKELKLELAHPKSADAWQTRKLLMTYPQPSPNRILECKETAESASATSKNLRDMDDAALSIGTKVQQNKAQYHWCFYQLMTDLDLKLERDSSLLTEKSELFFARMRTLWVLASSLDTTNPGKETIYNNYLRKRYMEISQHQFGRPVEVIDPDVLMQTAGKSGKAASSYQDPE